MTKLGKGLFSGLVATASLTALMIAESATGIATEFPIVNLLADVMQSSMTIGWAVHFVIGTVIWGTAFAYLVDTLPGGTIGSAILFSIGAWIVMMVGTMPLASAGVTGDRIWFIAPAAMFTLHIFWGATLGLTYARLTHDGNRFHEPAN